VNEERLREILAKEIGCPVEAITDETSVETTKGFDSLTVMHVVFAVEAETDLFLDDDTVATFTSWPNIRAAVLGKPVVTSFLKALVLDADNTIWKGVLGEGGISMTDEFMEAQTVYRGLKARGVILCLSSKNDSGAVALEQALDQPGMPLHYRDFAVIEATWGSKVESLRKIARLLNIGLDSMVFVDDSDFEVEAVRTQLPEVTVVQVPKELTDYPQRASEIAAMFPTMVDLSKTEQYHALAAAEKTRPLFASEEEYLASLGMKVAIHRNWLSEVPRIAELTQKTNQFNLTTKRYVDEVIAQLMGAPGTEVYSLHLRDRFGDQGLVGVLIVVGNRVDTFLLSCRALGRGVEFTPWGIFRQALYASYVSTGKNSQVADFWERVGLAKLPGFGDYYGPPTVQSPPYIEVISEPS
jgi:FkbH-like protein